jgi:hypothetical protein
MIMTFVLCVFSTAYLHQDVEELMPKNTTAWAVWNFSVNSKRHVYMTYWLNHLQVRHVGKHMASLLNILPFFCFSFMHTEVKFDRVFGALVNLLTMDMDFTKTTSRYTVFSVHHPK